MVSLQDAVRLLGSEKVRERNDGMDRYRQIFDDDRAIRQLSDSDHDGQRWLRTMQALFNCVIVERSACLKKGSDWRDAAPITIKRLNDASRLVHWMIERVHTHLPEPTFDAVFNHVTQMLDYRNRLFEPLALDYLKSLRTLVSHAPHLEHLNAQQWQAAVTLCFNVVLGDGLKTPLDSSSDEDVLVDRPDDEEAYELDDGDVRMEERRKGRLEDVEVMACIQSLVASPYAPLLSQQGLQLGVRILAKYLRFLAALQGESSAHLPALVGLNHVLYHMDINETRVVSTFAQRAWSDLLSLLGTKHKVLKEQVIIAFSTLAYHVENEALLAPLYASLSCDCEQRWGLQPLSASAYDYRLFADGEAERPFIYSSFRAGRRFTSQDVVVWLAQELAADILQASASSSASLPPSTNIDAREGTSTTDTSESRGRSRNGNNKRVAELATQTQTKRRRINSPANGLLQPPLDDVLARAVGSDAHIRSQSKAARLWALQVLTIFLARHGSSLQQERILDVASRLVTVLSDGDHDIQSAALVCAASLACVSEKGQAIWQQMWTIACRRLQIVATSRAAAHAAHAILTYQLVPREMLISDTHNLLSELDVQGPVFAADAICRFLSSALILVSGDAVLANRNLEDGVFAWLQTNWSPLHRATSLARPEVEEQDPSDIVDLLARICSLQYTSASTRTTSLLLPDCPAVRHAQREEEVGDIRRFILRSELPPLSSAKSSGNINMQTSQGQDNSEARTMRPRENRATALLSKAMRAFEAAWEDSLADPVSSASSVSKAGSEEKVKATVDFALLVLLFAATLSVNGIQTTQLKPLIASATAMLSKMIELLAQPRWSSTARAFALAGLSLVLPFSETATALRLGAAKGMERPGPQSGVRREMVNQACEESTNKEDSVVVCCWTLTQTDRIIEAVRSLANVLYGHKEEQNEAWVGHNVSFQEANDPSLTGDNGGSDHTRFALRLCISATVNIARYGRETEKEGPLADQALIEAMLDGEVAGLLLLIEAVSPQIASHRLHLNLNYGNQLLERLASDLLGSYSYERNEEAQLRTLDILDSTIETWTVKATANSGDFNKNAQKLLGYFSKQLTKAKLSCPVSMRVNALLERYLSRVSSEPGDTTVSKISTLAPITIVDTLLISVNHVDVRARFAAATMTARLFAYWFLLDLEVADLYSRLQKALPRDTSSWELMQTRIVLLGNVVVATSAMRYLALWHLIELTMVSPEFQSSTRAVLSAASSRLGYSSLQDLWLVFASHLTYAMIESAFNFDELPYIVLGYDNKKEYANQSYLPVASMLLAVAQPESLEAFRSLTKLVHKSDKEAALACVPFLIATEVGLAETDMTNASQDPDGHAQLELDDDAYRTIYQKTISGAAAKMSTGKGTEGLVSDRLDSVVAALICQFYETDLAEGAFMQGLQRWDPACASLLGELTVSDKSVKLHEPNRPMWSATTVYHALRALVNNVNDALGAQTIYNAIIDVADVVYRERTFNDQLRHLQGLKLYVAMAQETISKDAMLLRLMLRIATVLLEQSDLFETVWPLVEWTLTATCSLPRAFSGLSDTLVSLFDLRLAREDLTDRLEPLVLRMLRSDGPAAAVTQALYTWSGPLPESITGLVMEPELDNLVLFIKDQDHVNVAMLRRVLSSLQEASDESIKRQFSSSTIWKLFAALKGREKLHKEDEDEKEAAIIVADIIFECKGQLHNPSVRNLLDDEANSPLEEAVQELQKFKSEDTVKPLKAWLIVQISEVIQSKDLSRSKRAADCIKQVLATKAPVASWQERWPDLVRAELDALSTFAVASASAAQANKRKWSELDKSVELADDFAAWICWFSSFLCDVVANREGKVSAFSAIAHLVAADVALASSTMPVLLHIFLRVNLATAEEKQQAAHLAAYFIAILRRRGKASKDVWSAILKTVLYLRKDAPSDGQMSCDLWLLGLDFLELAERAIDCSLFTSSLLFVELAREHRDPADEDQERILALQYQIYSNVDDPDGFYGIKDPDVGQSLVKRLQHEGEWQRAFELRGAEFESGSLPSTSWDGQGNITACLHRMGFNRLAARLATSSESSVDIGYDTAWRVGLWNLPVKITSEEAVPSQNLYAALRAHHRERTSTSMDRVIDTSLSSELANLSRITVEANASARQLSRELLGLRETKRWRAKDQIQESLNDDFDFDDLECILSVRLSLLRSEKERLKGQRIGDVLDEAAKDNMQRECSLLLDVSRRAREQGSLTASINAVTQARQLRRLLDDEVGEEAALKSRPDLVGHEFAHVLWAQGEHAMAIEALAGMLKDKVAQREQADRDVHASALARLGQWRSIARSHQAKVIDEECFKPALSLFRGDTRAPEKAKVCYQFAVFADEQYRALMASEEVRNLEAFVGHRREELAQIHVELQKAARQSDRWRQLVRARQKAEKIEALDQTKLREHEGAKEQFRLEAAQMYAVALATSDNVDDAAVRLTSLWFENAELQDLNEKLGKHLAKVPSAKFLPLTHQISSRLNKPFSSNSPSPSVSPSPGGACSAFQTNINDLVFRMCKDHPFQSLYALYALAMGAHDAAKEENSRSKGKKRTSTAQDEAAPVPSQVSRGATAEEIINRVRTSSSPKMRGRIDAWFAVCEACRQWAQLSLEKTMPTLFQGGRRGGAGSIKKGAHPIPSSLGLAISKLRDVEVPVITRDLAVDPTGKYEDYVGIARYSAKFATAGGIHLPKIIDCIGTDGRAYRQLFKDEDDLRQDAVMQQVFRLVNGLLQQDQRAKRRRLAIRTYHVVPLGPRYGLLEFVGNTMPLQEPLMDTHTRYRRFSPSYDSFSMAEGDGAAKHTLTPIEARQLISAAAGKETRERVAVFEDVCSRMPPTLRLYFFEKYTAPMAWFGARLNYTRSVATSSIVGHVLGLGDRHVSNILLDQVSGEVVHIDFGVAFDQGRLLPIPELVPFRLTRDVVDGMGSTGVEGVFRSSAQETLRVLREARPIIKTVLEVFKYDPLFDWTQNPVKVLRAQAAGGDEADAVAPLSGSSTSSSSAPLGGGGGGGGVQPQQQQHPRQARETAELQAERAINSVMNKLGDGLSVEYTVNDLIQRATDTTNLACIFHGWQAAL
ncbi:hypothetical protein FA10DRAFT_266372 [Acaromyces ingoldii]|uniref:Serine/threonine-protein kinase Tel1 n=1 Tax=Acaromyces ingoldii TaxID=215250 RepID=A0A316YKS2_9BASI|nr:hypothetical protein FA10DRAFT_266372 [Acaromyces ingoldii]PWN89821.1 hypothetical protein FA10DRAFT_266372 [Acaromyces ingoldii]